MKLIGRIGHQMIKPTSEPKIVHFIAVIGGWKKLKEPTLSSEMACLLCSEKTHHAPLVDPKLGEERVWICANALCSLHNRSNWPQATTIEATPKRAIVWPLFCEISGVGDVYHDVLFENIEQSAGKIEYLNKFIVNPTGILIMQGDKGTGKTYCSLAVCEYLTRTETSVMFMTQQQMMDKWLATFKEEKPSNFINKVKECTLLVIDDFGTTTPSPGFMAFFMDIINTRMQWKKRGTIITTNANNQSLSDFCGDSLSDRLNTGQKFLFEGNTRRKSKVL